MTAGLLATVLAASVPQPSDTAPVTVPVIEEPPDYTVSVMVGGFGLGRSLLLLGKAGYERGHLAGVLDLSRDSLRITWPSDEQDDFILWALSASGRAYSHPNGRGAFFEGSLSLARLDLYSVGTFGERTSASAWLPMAGFGLGLRLGQSPTGFFGEISFRSTTALTGRDLVTRDDGSGPPTFTGVFEGTWVFRPGDFTSQLYLGVGYSL